MSLSRLLLCCILLAASLTGEASARPFSIAHRGAPTAAPENTLSSYRAAIARHADFVETDVAETADGELVLMHDDQLRRTTNVADVFPGRAGEPVSAFTLAEIRQLDAGKWFSAEFSGEKVPTLAELLALLHDNKTGLFLELKSQQPDLADKVAAQLLASGWVQHGALAERLVVISFYSQHLRILHALLPFVPSSLLVQKPLTEPQVADVASYTSGIDFDFSRLDAHQLALCKKYGLAVYVWTVDQSADIDSMLALPLDGITTNNLDYLAAAQPFNR